MRTELVSVAHPDRGEVVLSRPEALRLPGLVVEGDSRNFFEYPGTSNRLGYRDRDHATAKPPGTYRIEVFANDACDGSGSGEGASLVGSTTIIDGGPWSKWSTDPSITVDVTPGDHQLLAYSPSGERGPDEK